MFLFFSEASNIAKNRLQLPRISRAFYYIALAYLPILLFSISLFELFGNYLSIYGPGKYIYFSISNIILTIIYYRESNRINNNYIGTASVVFSILAIISTVSIYTTNYSVIIGGIALYTLILELLYNKKMFYLKEQIHKKTVEILNISLSIVLLYNNLWNIRMNNINIFDILICMILYASIYYYYNRINKDKRVFETISPWFILFTFFNISQMLDVVLYKQMVLIISVIIIYLIDLISTNMINRKSYIASMICCGMLYINSLCYMIGTQSDLALDVFDIPTIFQLIS